jgi:hypothetical protein
VPRIPIDWLTAGVAVLLALATYRIAAPDTVCAALVPPATTSSGLGDAARLTLRDLNLPRELSLAGFGVAALLAIVLRPSLLGRLLSAALFAALGLLALVTFAFGVGVVSCLGG